MKTTTTCQVCGVEFTRVHTVGKLPKHCSRACANKAPGRMTPEIRARIGRAGRKHPNFTGEWTAVDRRTGTVRAFVWLSPEEQVRYGYKRPYMLRSRYVWNKAHPEDPVRRGQVIHHKDENPLNDAIENLEKLPSQREHAAHHFRQPRGPMSEAHKAAVSAAKLAKRPLSPRYCEQCGNELSRPDNLRGGRFCSASCHYAFRRGKPRSGW